MKRLLVFIVCLFVHSIATADWRIDERVDAMTDEVKKTAIVQNELVHTFSIYRLSEGGPVWGNFALSEGRCDQVDWEKPPIYRVDKNEPIRWNEDSTGVSLYQAVLGQLKAGRSIQTRYTKWPSHITWDENMPLEGFTAAYNEAKRRAAQYRP